MRGHQARSYLAGINHESAWYEIRLEGRIDPRWAAWFDGLTVSAHADGTSVIHGQVADQAALHGLLQRLRDLGLPLLSVDRVDPDQTQRKLS
ncbi:hypothetical protein OG809_35830 [Kribbella soli]